MVRKVRYKYVSFALNISTSVEQLIAILAVLTRSNDYEKIHAKTQN